MLKFDAEDWYEISGRGWVATGRNPARFERDNCPYIGQEVEIGGKVYRIRGVESHALGVIREGAPIGLLVDGKPPEKPEQAE